MRPLRLNAAWALPVAAPPIRGAAILLDAGGRIGAIGPDASVPSPEDAESIDLGPAILLPGLVNVHTHLELTGFGADADDLEFRQWILGIRRKKSERTPAEFLAAARAGIRDCWAAGVTTVADTGDSGAVPAALAELGGRGVAYQEVFGPHPGQLEESLEALKSIVRAQAAYASERIRLGVSPHAPYTVSGPLYSAVAAWARSERLPMAVHIAESPAESEFVTQGAGSFAEGWKKRGIPPLTDRSHQPERGAREGPSAPSPVQWLDSHGVLGPETLCIHAVQLSEPDIELLAARGVAIAHCPLSNARHRHGSAPLGALRKAGIRVGIGTDSVASVGKLDLLAEARAARALGALSAAETLALATLRGAEALGLEAGIGSLVAGKWGDVAAVAPNPEGLSSSADPIDQLLASGPEDVVLTVLGGRPVYRRNGAA